MIWTILSWTMSAIALLGTIINAEQNKYGFIFWIISNLYMVIRFAVIGEYAQMTLFFVYFILAVRGFCVWSMNEVKKELGIERKWFKFKQ